eukprot:2669468-Rhodomonas_salina.12
MPRRLKCVPHKHPRPCLAGPASSRFAPAAAPGVRTLSAHTVKQRVPPKELLPHSQEWCDATSFASDLVVTLDPTWPRRYATAATEAFFRCAEVARAVSDRQAITDLWAIAEKSDCPPT